jgi:transposase IS4-like protein/DDE family transposase
MRFRIRDLETECKLCHVLSIEALQRAIPREAVVAVLAEHGARTFRARKLTLEAIVWVVIAFHLFTQRSIGDVLEKIAHGLRLIWPGADEPLPNDSALTYRRYQLGARPLAALFHRICRPLATPHTQGAFLFGLRLMAIDGCVEDVPDTPENAAYFGRHHGDRGDSAFPQVQAVYLCECGTHAILDAGFWPCHTSERVGGFRMLRSVEPGMLVMWDCGFHDFDMIAAVCQRQAHVLSRLSAHVKPQFVRRLADGSYLAWLRPSEYHRRRSGERRLVRILTYTLTDPARPGAGEVHRLTTTLLSPKRYPALDLICAYHERWEVEVVIDETQTHQRLAGRPLRSRKPVGVIQELYGLLLAHYAVRFLMHEAAQSAGLDPDRISFVRALRLIQDAVADFQIAAEEVLPALYQRLLADIAAEPLPPRRHRSYPRVVKRKMSKFKLKRAEHQRPPRLAGPFREAVALI